MATASKKKGGGQEVPVTQEKKGVKKVEPGHLLSPFEEMENMFESFFPRGWMHPFHFGHPFGKELPSPFIRTAPRVDIINHKNEVILRAQVPGVDKKDLDVSISDNTVTIKGHTSHEEKEEKGDYYRRECSYGSFSRTFALPGDVDGSKAKAEFKNGVLELTIPRIKESKHRSIQID